MADRDKNRGIDQRNKRDRDRQRNRLGDEWNPNMEAAEEFDARRAQRRRDNCRMEVSADLGVRRDQDRDRRCNAERCDDKQQ